MKPYHSVLVAMAVWSTTLSSNAVGVSVAEDIAATVGNTPAPEVAIEGYPSLTEYGAFLFESPLLSRDGIISCSSCHVPQLAFSGPSARPVGEHGAIGSRHPPTLINLSSATKLMWDGRASDLEQQIHIPLEAADEMDIDWSVSLKRLSADEGTQRLLRANPAVVVDQALVVFALAAYVRSLTSSGSPFDRYFYSGQGDAISPSAAEGLDIFIRKARCSSCHLISGQAAPLTDGSFHSVGVGFQNGKYADDGRYELTRIESDRGAFKTPTLRNVTQRKFFMHDGSMNSLSEVVDYYDRGGNRLATNLDPRIRPLFLTAREKSALIAFLDTLTAPVANCCQP